MRRILTGAGLGAALVWAGAREARSWQRAAEEEPPPWRRTPPRVSVLVPTLNEAAYVRDACRDLAEQRHRAEWPDRVEILLVDSGSADDTVARAEPFVDRVVNAPKGKLNALTAGIDAASGEIIAEADADARFHPAWLGHLISAFRDEGVAGAFGPVDYQDSPLIRPLNGMLLPANLALGKFPAGARAYRRSAYERVNGFDVHVDQQNLPRLWFEEEFAFAARLRAIGEVRMVPGAVTEKSARRMDPLFVRDERAQKYREEVERGERFGVTHGDGEARGGVREKLKDATRTLTAKRGG